MAGLGKYCIGGYGWIGVYRVKQGCLVDFIKHLFFIINPSHVRPDHAYKWSLVESLHYIVNIQKTKSLRIYRLLPIRKTNALSVTGHTERMSCVEIHHLREDSNLYNDN